MTNQTKLRPNHPRHVLQPSALVGHHMLALWVYFATNKQTDQPNIQLRNQTTNQTNKQTNRPTKHPTAQPNNQPNKQTNKQTTKHSTAQPNNQTSKQPTAQLCKHKQTTKHDARAGPTTDGFRTGNFIVHGVHCAGACMRVCRRSVWSGQALFRPAVSTLSATWRLVLDASR